MFGKKKIKTIDYDHSLQIPAMRVSICTGEKVAGLQDISTKKFHDIELIRNDKELVEFCEACGISKEEIKIIN